MSGQMESVRRQYHVPAARGKRVTWRVQDYAIGGRILSSTGSHLRVLLDEVPPHYGRSRRIEDHPCSFDYLDGISPERRLSWLNHRLAVWNAWLNHKIERDEYALYLSEPLLPDTEIAA